MCVKKLIGFLVMTLMLSTAVWAGQGRGNEERGKQEPAQGGERGVGNGHIPAHGPAPSRAPAPAAKAAPAQQARRFRDQPTHPEAPHVHAENDTWVGHDTSRNDPHYHLDRP